MSGRLVLIVVGALLVVNAALVQSSGLLDGAEQLDDANLRLRIPLRKGWTADGEAIELPEYVPRTAPPRERIRYQRTVAVPWTWRNQGRVLVKVDRATHWARVFWNGVAVGEHHGARTAFEIDVTAQVRYGERNQLELQVENAWTGHPWPGVESTDPSVVKWYINDQAMSRHAGVTGEVALLLRPELWLDRPIILTSVRSHTLSLSVAVHNDGGHARSVALEGVVSAGGGPILTCDLGSATVAAGGQATLQAQQRWDAPTLWGPPGYGQPQLYILRLDAMSSGEIVDRRFTPFGFREFWMDGQQLMMNGRPFFIMGRRMPLDGAWLSDRCKLREALIVLMRGGINVAESHIQSRQQAFYDAADEVGMPVISGNLCFGAIGSGMTGFSDTARRALSDQARDWYAEEQNHPCVFMWNPCLATPALHQALDARVAEVDSTRLLPERDFGEFTPEMQPGAQLGQFPGGAPVFISEMLGDEGMRSADMHAFIKRARDQHGILGVLSSSGLDGRGPFIQDGGALQLSPMLASWNLRALQPTFVSQAPLPVVRCPPEVAVRVSVHGEAVADALVTLSPMDADSGPTLGAFTDARGVAAFVPGHPGRYVADWEDGENTHRIVIRVTEERVTAELR